MTEHNQTENAPEENQNEQQENVVNLEETVPEEQNSEISLEGTILALQEELAGAKDKMMRALADAENTRRRALKDREDAGNFAISKFAKDLLDYADNFGRALESLPEGTPEAVSGGLKAMETEIMNVFTRHGVQKIEPLDEQFNANFHEVMFETPMPGKSAGTIIQVIEPGYVLNERLLRAAKVGIAKGEEGQSPQDPGVQIDEEA